MSLPLPVLPSVPWVSASQQPASLKHPEYTPHVNMFPPASCMHFWSFSVSQPQP